MWYQNSWRRPAPRSRSHQLRLGEDVLARAIDGTGGPAGEARWVASAAPHSPWNCRPSRLSVPQAAQTLFTAGRWCPIRRSGRQTAAPSLSRLPVSPSHRKRTLPLSLLPRLAAAIRAGQTAGKVHRGGGEPACTPENVRAQNRPLSVGLGRLRSMLETMAELLLWSAPVRSVVAIASRGRLLSDLPRTKRGHTATRWASLCIGAPKWTAVGRHRRGGVKGGHTPAERTLEAAGRRNSSAQN